MSTCFLFLDIKQRPVCDQADPGSVRLQINVQSHVLVNERRYVTAAENTLPLFILSHWFSYSHTSSWTNYSPKSCWQDLSSDWSRPSQHTVLGASGWKADCNATIILIILIIIITVIIINIMIFTVTVILQIRRCEGTVSSPLGPQSGPLQDPRGLSSVELRSWNWQRTLRDPQSRTGPPRTWTFTVALQQKKMWTQWRSRRENRKHASSFLLLHFLV